jgi:hypothetical protein
LTASRRKSETTLVNGARYSEASTLKSALCWYKKRKKASQFLASISALILKKFLIASKHQNKR